jgi:hypothetical protein
MSYPLKWEYKLHRTEYIPASGGATDELSYLQELGQEGWEVVEVRYSKENSGMLTDDKRVIPKIVMEVLAKRALLEQEM